MQVFAGSFVWFCRELLAHHMKLDSSGVSFRTMDVKSVDYWFFIGEY